VLREQRLPDSWVIALVDRNRRFVARIPSCAPVARCRRAFRAAINRSPNGWFAGTRPSKAREAYTPYVTSELSGWVMGIAIPAANRRRGGQPHGDRHGRAASRRRSRLALLLGWYMARPHRRRR
jgi:hypothetical protein